MSEPGHPRLFFLIYIAGLTSLVSSCHPDESVGSIVQRSEWKSSSAQEQGIDPVLLGRTYARADSVRYLNSLLVVRNGYLVSEQYFHGYSSQSLMQVRSVTKSVTSILIGIASERGLGINDRLGGLLPGRLGVPGDSVAASITVEDLLTMRSGFQWNEDSTLPVFLHSTDPVAFMLGLPFSDPPGQRFHYNTGSAHLLSPVLQLFTGMTELDFAQERVFKSLGITTVGWQRDPTGYYYGSVGLLLKPRDMARLGVLMMNIGSYNGIQVIAPSWVQTSLSAHVQLSGTWGPLTNLTYGYLWWGGTMDGHRVTFAEGYGGQFVMMVADLNLLIVTAAEWNLPASDASSTEDAILDIMAHDLLPAVSF
jgi:CubicO group peptidase (beta-lactamase class C family)